MSLKSPISVLQEITQQKRVCPPVYNIENSMIIGQPFVCSVEAIGITAKAYGSNKKDCKHKAAEKALEILGYKINSNSNNNNEPFQPACSLLPFSDILPSANYVGQLNEFASGRQFSYPTYHENMGNLLNFVVECRFLNWSTTGTGPNKKSAKQKAAQFMLERLRQEDFSTMYTQFQNVSISRMEISKLTDVIVEKYRTLPSFGMNSAIEEELKKPVLDLVEIGNIEDLRRELKSQGFETTLETFHKDPYLVKLNITATNCLIVGYGETEQQAFDDLCRMVNLMLQNKFSFGVSLGRK